jgi:hypothetical protein
MRRHTISNAGTVERVMLRARLGTERAQSVAACNTAVVSFCATAAEDALVFWPRTSRQCWSAVVGKGCAQQRQAGPRPHCDRWESGNGQHQISFPRAPILGGPRTDLVEGSTRPGNLLLPLESARGPSLTALVAMNREDHQSCGVENESEVSEGAGRGPQACRVGQVAAQSLGWGRRLLLGSGKSSRSVDAHAPRPGLLGFASNYRRTQGG